MDLPYCGSFVGWGTPPETHVDWSGKTWTGLSITLASQRDGKLRQCEKNQSLQGAYIWAATVPGSSDGCLRMISPTMRNAPRCKLASQFP